MAGDRFRLARALAAITVELSEPAELPARLCGVCLEVLPVDGVGVTLVTRDQEGRAMLGASDAVGARIEQLQFDLGEGPCVSAFSDARPVLVSDLGAADPSGRWPMFTRAAQALGVGALFAFPLQVGISGIGVLDCYRANPGALEAEAEALAVADAVTLALLNYQAQLTTEGGPGDGADLFDLSWRNHAVVHQATGALAARLKIDTGEALARLRGYAFRHARRVDEVAEDVMAGRLDLGEEQE